MRLLSHPLRITPTGQMATVEDGSDAAVGEAIAVLIGTRLGERVMQPTFGIPDPVWLGLRAADVNAGLDIWGPQGVSVTGVKRESASGGGRDVTLQWERL